MKVYFLINSLYSAGGTERMTTQIAESLAERGFETKIICLHGGKEPFFKLSSNVKVECLTNSMNSSIYKSYLKYVFCIHKILRKNRPDFIVDVCSAMSLMSIPASLFTKVKVITWEHFNANMNWNYFTSPIARTLSSIFSKKIVVLTNTDKLVFERRFKANNVVCIKNPNVLGYNEKSSLYSKKILSIGRLENQKGYDILIDIWAKCKCKDFGWQLNIVGEGSQYLNLTRKVLEKDLGETLIFHKPTLNMKDYYLDASVFVLSSRFEGLPLVLIEAMSMGLPIVSFDCETGPRDIVENGRTGFLIDVFNTDLFAQKIDELCFNSSLMKEFSDNSILNSHQFEIEPIVDQWINLLEND